jgi:hypothetical protein
MSVQVSLSTLFICASKYFADRASIEITDETDEEYLKNSLPEHMHRLVDEIAADRKVLKLPPLPAYLHKDRVQSSQFTRWDANPGTIDHAVPESYASFAKQSERIMRILYGDNAPRLVKQIAKDDSVRSAGTFNGGYRVLKADTTDTITGGSVLFVNLHEDAHANDPQITDADLYPLQTLVHVTHGISRILSQANEIDGYYLDNPKSYNIPFIKKQIGEGIGTIIRRDPTLAGQMDDESYDSLMAILVDIASSRGVAIADLKFTKHVCQQIGDACLCILMDPYDHRLFCE